MNKAKSPAPLVLFWCLAGTILDPWFLEHSCTPLAEPLPLT